MFLHRRHDSKDMARERLMLLLLAERVECSPQTMVMMENDVIQAVGKYLPTENKGIRIKIHPVNNTLEIQIPLMNNTKKRREDD